MHERIRRIPYYIDIVCNFTIIHCSSDSVGQNLVCTHPLETKTWSFKLRQIIPTTAELVGQFSEYDISSPPPPNLKTYRVKTIFHHLLTTENGDTVNKNMVLRGSNERSNGHKWKGSIDTCGRCLVFFLPYKLNGKNVLLLLLLILLHFSFTSSAWCHMIIFESLFYSW